MYGSIYICSTFFNLVTKEGFNLIVLDDITMYIMIIDNLFW